MSYSTTRPYPNENAFFWIEWHALWWFGRQVPKSDEALFREEWAREDAYRAEQQAEHERYMRSTGRWLPAEIVYARKFGDDAATD